MSAEFGLKDRRSRLLARAGSEGVQVEGVFYPHSRIDRIAVGDIEVFREGDPGM